MIDREQEHLVFIYGTLKRGFPNHSEGLLGRYYVGPGSTINPYPLCIADQWYSPALINEPGNGVRVSGELYAVDADTLATLDRMEGVGQSWGYRRYVIEVQIIRDQSVEAWTYMKNRASLAQIHSTDLAEYLPDEHYVPACCRS